MGTLRVKKVKKSQEELIKEYCEKTNTNQNSLIQYIQEHDITEKWLENLVKSLNIEIYKRVYFDSAKEYKIEIKQGNKVTNSFIAYGDTVEKAIRAKIGYTLALQKVDLPDKADMIVTILDCELQIYSTTPKISFYRILSARNCKGSLHGYVDWKTGKKINKGN